MVEGTHEYYANGILVHNCGDAVVLAHLPVVPVVIGTPPAGRANVLGGAPAAVFGKLPGAW